ncbi:D-alanyl-D-alanine carboxypeptidase [Nocardia tenerifensis]|uniref:D-alanyl-D-alanine carboxypeptidase n=1 Tax=Nocardia tenerifensis TaxID=228006 RepID=A0A318K5S6_9NOCA|nr:serine hydrolase domain-containing protein [Nocardia tenerifensis]PXX68395.1 D-alanyl-D-alanine carboxypeptidase [Nocardia tenerifensis]
MRIAPIIAALSSVALLAGCTSDQESNTVSDNRIRAVQADIDGIVASGVTGVIATLTDHTGTVVLTSGVADIVTRAPIPAEPPQQTRIGSISKTFTSAIVLQLVAEGKVRLDEPVETYLPGTLRGDGIDGRAITVRQILRHQSGLPDFAADPRVDEYRAALENRTMTPAEGMAIVLSRPADFAPGARYEYSNSNYLVAAVLVEKVTGAPYVEELQRRILEPQGLADTYLPAPGDREIRGPHPKGYAVLDGTLTDVTRIEPSVPWAAGGLISTGADLNRFYTALLAGRVVPDAQLREMNDGVLMDEGMKMYYGLGLGHTTLPCGAEYFGHSGGIYGYNTVAGATPEGRAVTFAFTKEPDKMPDLIGLLGHALCP